MKVKWKVVDYLTILFLVLAVVSIKFVHSNKVTFVNRESSSEEVVPQRDAAETSEEDETNPQHVPPGGMAKSKVERFVTGEGDQRQSMTNAETSADTGQGQRTHSYSKSTGYGSKANSGGYAFSKVEETELNETNSKEDDQMGHVAVSHSLSISTSGHNSWVQPPDVVSGETGAGNDGYGPRDMSHSIAISDSSAVSGRNKASGKALSYASGNNGSAAEAGSSARTSGGPQAETKVSTDLTKAESGGMAFSASVAEAGRFTQPNKGNKKKSYAKSDSVVSATKGAEANAQGHAVSGEEYEYEYEDGSVANGTLNQTPNYSDSEEEPHDQNDNWLAQMGTKQKPTKEPPHPVVKPKGVLKNYKKQGENPIAFHSPNGQERETNEDNQQNENRHQDKSQGPERNQPARQYQDQQYSAPQNRERSQGHGGPPLESQNSQGLYNQIPSGQEGNQRRRQGGSQPNQAGQRRQVQQHQRTTDPERYQHLRQDKTQEIHAPQYQKSTEPERWQPQLQEKTQQYQAPQYQRPAEPERRQPLRQGGDQQSQAGQYQRSVEPERRQPFRQGGEQQSQGLHYQRMAEPDRQNQASQYQRSAEPERRQPHRQEKPQQNQAPQYQWYSEPERRQPLRQADQQSQAPQYQRYAEPERRQPFRQGGDQQSQPSQYQRSTEPERRQYVRQGGDQQSQPPQYQRPIEPERRQHMRQGGDHQGQPAQYQRSVEPERRQHLWQGGDQQNQGPPRGYGYQTGEQVDVGRAGGKWIPEHKHTGHIGSHQQPAQQFNGPQNKPIQRPLKEAAQKEDQGQSISASSQEEEERKSSKEDIVISSRENGNEKAKNYHKSLNRGSVRKYKFNEKISREKHNKFGNDEEEVQSKTYNIVDKSPKPMPGEENKKIGHNLESSVEEANNFNGQFSDPYSHVASSVEHFDIEKGSESSTISYAMEF